MANNSSGMCCGIEQNAYRTLQDIRVVFQDGTVLDTADPASCRAFQHSSSLGTRICRGLRLLANEVQADPATSDLIKHKNTIKCTTGYALNALVDFPPEQPIEILKRLMVGSEGTLGFISRVAMNTVVDEPFKASAFVLFPTVHQAANVSLCVQRRQSGRRFAVTGNLPNTHTHTRATSKSGLLE